MLYLASPSVPVPSKTWGPCPHSQHYRYLNRVAFYTQTSGLSRCALTEDICSFACKARFNLRITLNCSDACLSHDAQRCHVIYRRCCMHDIMFILMSKMKTSLLGTLQKKCGFLLPLTMLALQMTVLNNQVCLLNSVYQYAINYIWLTQFSVAYRKTYASWKCLFIALCTFYAYVLPF